MNDARTLEGYSQLTRLSEAMLDLRDRRVDLDRRIIQHRLYDTADLPEAIEAARALADGLEALLTPSRETPLRWPITPKEMP